MSRNNGGDDRKQRRPSAVDLASTMSTCALLEMQQEVCTQGILVLPGSGIESALFHIGVIARLIQNGYLTHVTSIFSQDKSNPVAALLWSKWQSLVELTGDPDDIQAMWSVPAQALFMRPMKDLSSSLQAVGINDDIVLQLHPNKPTLHMIRSDVRYGNANVFSSHGANMISDATRPAYKRINYEYANEYSYDRPSLRLFTMCMTNGSLFTNTEALRFRRGIRAGVSMWSVIAQFTVSLLEKGMKIAVFMTSACPPDEYALMEKCVRDLSQVEHDSSGGRVLCLRIPYHENDRNPRAASCGPVPMLIRDNNQSRAMTGDPILMQNLARWGAIVCSRKQLYTGVTSNTVFRVKYTDSIIRAAADLSSTRRSRSLGHIDGLTADTKAHHIGVVGPQPVDTVHKSHQYRDNDWASAEAKRETGLHRNVDASELAVVHAMYIEQHDMGRTDDGYESFDTDTESSDSGSEYEDGDLFDPDDLRNTHACALSMEQLAAQANKKAPTMCQTYCGWLFGKKDKPKSVPPPPTAAAVSRASLRLPLSTHSRTSSTFSHMDDLNNIPHDSLLLAVERDGNPTYFDAARAIQRRDELVNTACTPRPSNVLDFTQMQL